MSALISILFIITALLLIGVVLIQQPKTAGGLFSGTGQSLLGTSGKNFWTKITGVLAAVFMALCLLQAALPQFKQSSSSVADTIEKQQQQAASQAQPAQAAPAPAQAVPNPQTKPEPQKAPETSAPAAKDNSKK